MKLVSAPVIMGLLVVAVAVSAGDKGTWDLEGVDKIVLDGVSGDVLIRKAEGHSGMVELDSRVRPDDAFKADVDRSRGRLRIKERWYGSSSGIARWTIYLQENSNIQLEISNASGGLEADGVSASINFESASGDIGLVDVELAEDSDFRTASGNFSIHHMTIGRDIRFSTASGDVGLEGVTVTNDCQFTTASGDIKVVNSTLGPDVKLSSASGDVVVRDVKLEGEADFSSASGEVSVHFGKLPDEDFNASSASGRVTLDVDSWGENFTLVLVKREDRGSIDCPFDYTSEREFEKGYHVYEEKIVKRGSGGPQIVLKTASGRIIVKN